MCKQCLWRQKAFFFFLKISEKCCCNQFFYLSYFARTVHNILIFSHIRWRAMPNAQTNFLWVLLCSYYLSSQQQRLINQCQAFENKRFDPLYWNACLTYCRAFVDVTNRPLFFFFFTSYGSYFWTKDSRMKVAGTEVYKYLIHCSSY